MVENIGYYTYEIPAEKRTEMLNLCLQFGIVLYHTEEQNTQMSFRLPVYQAKGIESIMNDYGIAYRRSQMKGLCGAAIHMMRHPGMIAGVIMALMLYLWLNGMVWEVRIVSRTDIDEDRVLQLLEECGLHEGSRISKLNEDEIVTDYLLRDEGIAFAAVHIRGVVVEVEIIPYEVKEEPENNQKPCNIVATEDALITDMTVYAGRAMVKVGETVRKGDVLVSGVISSANGTQLVHAVADVRGQRSETIGVTSPLAVRESKVVDRRFEGFGIRIFGHMFRFGKSNDENVTKEKKRLYLFNRIRLPIEISVYHYCDTAETERNLTEEEQQMRAEALLEEKMEQLISNGSLLFYEKKEEMTEAGFSITAQIVFESNIGKSLAFDIEKQ